MAESTVIDFRDSAAPPPADPVLAPYGFKWDKTADAWVPKRSAGGRPPKAAAPEPTPPEEKRDADPAWMAKDAPTPAPAPFIVTAQTKKDMKAAVGLIFAATGPMVMRVDPYCGTVLTQNLKPIADAVVPLLCESEMVVSFFQNAGGSNFMLWFALITAIVPVGQAIISHHITKTVQLVDHNGQVYAVHKDENGNFVVRDQEEPEDEPEEPQPTTRRGPAGFARYGV